MRISVVGLGKLGSPLLAVLAASGFETVGVDQNPNIIAAVQKGCAPVPEPGLQELFDTAGPRIRASGDIAEAVSGTDATFVIVPTPSKADATFSNTHVIAAIEAIGAALRSKSGYHLVVITSTVMPGATGGPVQQALERASHRRLGRDLGLCYNPEFIALGTVIHDLRHPDFILIGESDVQAGDMLELIHATICGNRPPVQRMNFVNAEIAKLAVNSFVTTKISFANMLSGICDHLPGADATAVANAIGCDTRIGSKYLTPALGYGGPCFPRDNAAFAAMASRIGASAEIAQAADAVNRQQVERVVRLVRNLLSTGTVGVLGLSYKPNTAIIEASQGIAIAAALAEGGYSVIVSDPQSVPAAEAVLGNMVETATAADCAARCDLLIVATPWPEFRGLPLDALRRPQGRLIVVDCWRWLPPDTFGGCVDLIYPGRGPEEDADRDAGSPPKAALGLTALDPGQNRFNQIKHV